ncbi:transmembrane protein, putative [Medicago truncatula]|uniref:Transmembrane protein, putative n=1 Tax=Medicago truncatula TaxID=3880 RepID=G7LFB8_MEDTR|nr:transmembrane protein, putative [Medicago truncatula]
MLQDIIILVVARATAIVSHKLCLSSACFNYIARKKSESKGKYVLQGYVILFLLGFISTIFIRSLFKKSVYYKLPPGPPISFPILGHAPYLRLSLLHKSFYKLSNRYRQLGKTTRI